MVSTGQLRLIKQKEEKDGDVRQLIMILEAGNIVFNEALYPGMKIDITEKNVGASFVVPGEKLRPDDWKEGDPGASVFVQFFFTYFPCF